MKLGLWTAAAVVLTAGLAAATPDDGDESKETEAVVLALPTAKVSLAAAIRDAAARGHGVPLSARYEIQDEGPDKGRLLAFVFAAQKGLVDDAASAELRQTWGLADAEKWAPETDEMDDDDIARAAQQETLLALSQTTLADVVAKVEKEQLGTVISAAPALRGRKPILGVTVVVDGKTTELTFDLKPPEAVADKPK